jgi:hypothetical protein
LQQILSVCNKMNYANLLAVAFAEVQAGFDEGVLLGRGRNRRVHDK